MKQSELKLLRQQNMEKVLRPQSPKQKKEDNSDELSKLFDDGTILESEKPAAQSSQQETASPSPDAPPAYREPPSLSEPGSQVSLDPLRNEPGTRHEPPARYEPVNSLLSPKSPHLRFPYEVLDQALGKLNPLPRVVLLRLYRLSAGFDSNRCHVSIGKLVSHCKIGETKMRGCLRELERDGYIRRIGMDVSNKNPNERGITFEVTLPRLPPARREGGLLYEPGAAREAGPPHEPNKVNTLKENTHKEGSVRVGSRFNLKQCRQYADSLKSEGIHNPGGYATTIHRTGKADELIERFLHPPAPSAPLDASQCPDCRGTGWWYPKGPEMGVARCKHERLGSTNREDAS